MRSICFSSESMKKGEEGSMSMKKCISILLAVLMVFSTLPVAFAADGDITVEYAIEKRDFGADEQIPITVTIHNPLAAARSVRINVKATPYVTLDRVKTDVTVAAGATETFVIEAQGGWVDFNNDFLQKVFDFFYGTLLSFLYEIMYKALNTGYFSVMVNGVEAVILCDWEIIRDCNIDGHAFGEYVSDGNATCTEDGTKTRTCTRCGIKETVADEGSALGHTPEEVAEKAPTCTEEGAKNGVICAVCGEVLEAEEVVPALGHTEEILPAVAPTCTETGLTEGKKCSVCGEILVAQEVVDALGHTPTEVDGREPTCTEIGFEKGIVCSVCGEVLEAQAEIPALGHTFGEWTETAPTCTEDGLKTRTCTVCGAVEEEVIPAPGHNYADRWEMDPATCTEEGSKWHPCEVCGDKGELTVIPALGHSFGEWAIDTAPTCTAEGLEKRTCNYCDAQETRPVAALGHTEEVIPAVAPTCTETGLTEGKKCSVCGEILTAQKEVPALGHKVVNGEVVIAATCTEDAQGYGVCEVCGEEITDTLIVFPGTALGHSFTHYTSDGNSTCTDNGTKTAICDRYGCFATDTIEGEKIDHIDENGDMMCDVCGSFTNPLLAVVAAAFGAIMMFVQAINFLDNVLNG